MSDLENITKFASERESFVEKYGKTALRFYLLEVSRMLLPNERVKICWRYPLPARKTVEIIYSDERGRARAKGTMKCGQGWVCPACMSYIQEQRRVELQTAMDRAQDDMITVMLTYTAQHDQGSRLAPMVASMTEAYRKTRSGRNWQDLKQFYSIRGSVRTMEVTFGANGWHPHFHELMFMDKSVLDANRAGGLDELSDALKGDVGGAWYEKLASSGMHTNIEKAFDVKAGNKYTADYINKFGRIPQNGDLSVSAYEITHSSTKTANRGGFGVLDLLFAAAHDKGAQRLFKEYHAATKGRSMVHWSRGLKTLLDINVIRDEIAAQGIETETDRILAEIDIHFWRWIGDRGFLAQVMTVSNEGDAVSLRCLLRKLEDRRDSEVTTLPQFDLGL